LRNILIDYGLTKEVVRLIKICRHEVSSRFGIVKLVMCYHLVLLIYYRVRYQEVLKLNWLNQVLTCEY